MIGQAVLALLAELVFGSATRMRRDYASEVEAYLKRRGFSNRGVR